MSTSCLDRASAEGKVEAEAVDVHFSDPVPQRIGDELQYVSLTYVDGVAAAGEVAVVPPVP